MSERLPPILVAEDDADDVLLLRRACERAHLANPLVVVDDVNAAIAYLGGTGSYADRTAFPLPIFLLLDIRMPRRSGFEVLRFVKSHETLHTLPVVVFTASRESADVQEAYDLGANSYLVKPGVAADLYRVVQTLGLFWSVHNVSPALGGEP